VKPRATEKARQGDRKAQHLPAANRCRLASIFSLVLFIGIVDVN
jgi:hypothetical protein